MNLNSQEIARWKKIALFVIYAASFLAMAISSDATVIIVAATVVITKAGSMISQALCTSRTFELQSGKSSFKVRLLSVTISLLPGILVLACCLFLFYLKREILF